MDKFWVLVIQLIGGILITAPFFYSYYSMVRVQSVTANGLNLTLTLNSAEIRPGGSVSLNLRLTNTFDTYNNVTAQNNWPDIKGLSLPLNDYSYFCSGTPLERLGVIGITVFKGYYVASNISSATSHLELEDPPPAGFILPACFILLQQPKVTGYLFYPHSSTARISELPAHVVLQSGPITYTYGPPIYVNETIDYHISTYGYANESPTSRLLAIQNFTPGTYTVVGADEWNQTVIAHFYVANTT